MLSSSAIKKEEKASNIHPINLPSYLLHLDGLLVWSALEEFAHVHWVWGTGLTHFSCHFRSLTLP
jgi:hypothetical protein